MISIYINYVGSYLVSKRMTQNEFMDTIYNPAKEVEPLILKGKIKSSGGDFTACRAFLCVIKNKQNRI